MLVTVHILAGQVQSLHAVCRCCIHELMAGLPAGMPLTALQHLNQHLKRLCVALMVGLLYTCSALLRSYMPAPQLAQP